MIATVVHLRRSKKVTVQVLFSQQHTGAAIENKIVFCVQPNQ